MITIVQINLYRTEIPLRTAFRHALKTRRKSQSVIVEIVTESGIRGFGEGAPREYVTGESTSTTIDRLFKACKALIGKSFSEKDSIECFSEILDNLDLANAPSARCALELALLDAWGKYTKQPAATLLNPKPSYRTIHFNGVVSGDSLKATKEWLYRIRDFGFDQVKVKVSNDHSLDLDRIELSRSILGSQASIRIDVNGAWELSESIVNIRRFSSLGIEIIEQPLAAKDREDYPLLMEELRQSGVHIILDESICNKDDAKWFIKNRGASGFNLKVSKHGGLWPSYNIYRMAQKAGMSCQLGCHVGETAILTLAGQSFATTSEDFLAYEGSFGRLLLEHDITKEDVTFQPGGLIDLSISLQNPGLGVEVDHELLMKCSQCTEL